ncbi:MAG TPA: SRPBCC family protein [Myxococcota bacterium]|nr:SRPBCC family protein [Myxococcota bacterium]
MPSFELQVSSPASAARTFAAITDLSLWNSFKGAGPVPGIVRATLASGTVGLGGKVRVENTDGSVHHETFTEFVPDKKIHLSMELRPPVSYIMGAMEETLELEGQGATCTLRRRFEVRARFFFTWPMAYVLCTVFLKRACEQHNAEVMRRLAAQSG